VSSGSGCSSESGSRVVDPAAALHMHQYGAVFSSILQYAPVQQYGWSCDAVSKYDYFAVLGYGVHVRYSSKGRYLMQYCSMMRLHVAYQAVPTYRLRWLGVREWGYLTKLEERIRAAMAILAAILAIL
jgi:hypothetical protein